MEDDKVIMENKEEQFERDEGQRNKGSRKPVEVKEAKKLDH